MKKKVLFVMDSLKIGGAEKSLITILNMLDYNKYDVDLYLFDHTGEFYSMIPKEVNVLKKDDSYKIFASDRKKSVIKYILQHNFKNAFYTFCWLVGAMISKISKKNLYIGWKFISKIIDPIEKEYDVSVAFLERKTIYFNVDKVKSKNKIGFIHNDYSKYPYNYKLDKKYFNSYMNIVAVSDNCKNVLEKIFPEYSEKFIVIKNMVSKEVILELSKRKIDNYSIKKDCTNIVSVGRLVNQKGFDIAIEICKKLVEEGININWYVIGEGCERNKIENLIYKYKLENNFFLVGSDSNPYKWIKIADIYVQPSRFEGYGITVAEAKTLEKMIIASNIPEFEEQLKNGKGIIANGIDDFVNKIEEIIENPNNKLCYINNLKKELTTSVELDKLIKLLNN